MLVTLACLPLFGLGHLLLLRWMRSTGSNLGALTDRYLVPLHAEWEPHWSLWLIPALVVTLVFIRGVVPLLLRLQSAKLMMLGAASYVALTLSVSMIDGFQSYGPEEYPSIILPLARTHLEYYGDVPLVENVGGPRAFIWKYAKPRLFQQLSLHSKTHPPGGAVFLWATTRLTGKGPWAVALSIVAFGSLASILTFLITRELYGDGAGRAALAAFLVTPNVVTYGATSMDAVFAVPVMLSLFLFLLSQRAAEPLSRCLLWGTLSGLALAWASFMSYAAVFVPLFFIVLAADPWKGRFGLARMSIAHGAGLLAFVVFYAALFLWAEYDPFAAVRASIAEDAEMVGTGHESLSHYWVINVSNLMAFAAGVGFPTVALWLLATRWRIGWPRDQFSRCFVAAWLIIGFSTLFTLEVERVWLFMSPFVLAPVGLWLTRSLPADRTLSGIQGFAGALAVNTLLAEAFLKIPW